MKRDFTFVKESTRNYLHYRLQDNDQIDLFCKKMIECNKIEAILPFSFSRINLHKVFCYNISTKLPLDQYLKNTLTHGQFVRLLLDIVNFFITTKDYMLAEEQLILDHDKIYIDTILDRIYFVYLPIQVRTEIKPFNLASFLKEIVTNAKVDDDGNEGYLSQILSCLNKKNFSPHDLKQLLETYLETELSVVATNNLTMHKIPISSVIESTSSAPVESTLLTETPQKSNQSSDIETSSTFEQKAPRSFNSILQNFLFKSN